MTSRLRSADGHDVAVPGEQNVCFPDLCVVCRKKVESETVAITGHPVGYWGLWKYIFGANPKLRVPAHVTCGKRLKCSLWLRNIFLCAICSAIAAAGLYFGWSIWMNNYVE